MRVGITVDDPDTVVDEARRAEALGFDYLGCGEHLFFHGPTPNSFAMLAAAAAVTSRIRLVTSIALLPLYPAAVVAKMASVIDCISDGRFELGVGAGGEFPPEFAAASVDVRTRFRRLDEGIEVIRRLFAGGSVTFEGTYARLSGLAALNYLLKENDLNPTGLSRILGADRTLGGKILRGERSLTVDHMKKLGRRFAVDPGIFVA